MTCFLWSSPNDGLRLIVKKEGDGHDPQALILVHVYRQPSLGALVDASPLKIEHLGNAWPTQVHVQQTHFLSMFYEGKGQLHSYSALSNSTLTREHYYNVLYRMQALHFVAKIGLVSF